MNLMSANGGKLNGWTFYCATLPLELRHDLIAIVIELSSL
jgi:hypothetical protein